MPRGTGEGAGDEGKVGAIREGRGEETRRGNRERIGK